MGTTMKKLSGLPNDFLKSLWYFLDNERNYAFLLEKLQKTALVMEKDGYQLSIQSADELSLIKSDLEVSGCKALA